MTKPVCVVAGIGPGNGAAFARRFAADGHAVALLSRAAEPARELAASLPDARAWQCDVGDAGSVARVFDEIRGALGDPEVVIYNAGSGVFGTFDDVTAADLEASWRAPASVCRTSRTPSSSSPTMSQRPRRSSSPSRARRGRSSSRLARSARPGDRAPRDSIRAGNAVPRGALTVTSFRDVVFHR